MLQVVDASEASWKTLEHGLVDTVYCRPAFWKFLESTAGGKTGVLVAYRGETPVGWLPYLAVELEHGRHLVNSLPWFGSLGGCFLYDRGDNEARRALLKAYANRLRELDALVAITILPPEEVEALGEYRDEMKPCGVEWRRGQMSQLPCPGGQAEERLFDVYKARTRRMVRKAQRQGYTIIDGTALDWAWNFLVETHQANMAVIGGKAKVREHFDALRRLPPGMVSLSLACENDDPAGALLLLHGDRQVEYCIPAIADAHRSRQPLSLLIHDALVKAVENGVCLWNWGGTSLSQESLHHFKEGWGASDYKYCYVIAYDRGDLPVIRGDVDRLYSLYPYYYVFPFSYLDRDEPLIRM